VPNPHPVTYPIRGCNPFPSSLALLLIVFWTVPCSLPAADRSPAKPLKPGADYRHIHRQAANDLFANRPDAAARWCQNFLQANPTDAEAWFLLTAALAQLNQPDRAREAFDQALQAGLPLGRFQAGPRSAFLALAQYGSKTGFPLPLSLSMAPCSGI
jgi:hypothetical protein